MWEEILIKPLKEQVVAYPERLLLDMLLELEQRQKERIEQMQAEVDGTAWSPSEW